MSSIRYATRRLGMSNMLRARPAVVGISRLATGVSCNTLGNSRAPLFFQGQARAQSTHEITLGTQQRLPEFSLKGKVVVVSGGAQGLGLTLCGGLLEAGANVYALDMQKEPKKEFHALQTKAQSELGQTLEYRQVDVRDVPTLNETIEKIADKENRIDGLIAAAGIQQEVSALDYKAEDVNRILSVNVTGVFMTAQAVARQMVKRQTGGSLVLIASMSGTVANKGLICPAYNTSKGGVLQLGRNLAAEWGQYGIRVNTISPGYIVTKMVEDLFIEYPERRESWPKDNMLGRLSAPEEYRGGAVFLLSDASSFMTGADLRMDGGHCAW